MTQNNNRGERGPPSVSEVGCFKCNKCRVACPIVKEGKSFKSTNTGRVYPIKQRLTCLSQYIVYLATWRKCAGQYVGKSTQQFRRRHSGHKQEVKNKIGGLGHHYGGVRGCCYENPNYRSGGTWWWQRACWVWIILAESTQMFCRKWGWGPLL